MYTVHLLSYVQSLVPIKSNNKACEKEIQMHPVGSFSKACLEAWLFIYLHYGVFFLIDGTFAASSGTGKVTGAERRPQSKQSFQSFHWVLIAVSFSLTTKRHQMLMPSLLYALTRVCTWQLEAWLNGVCTEIATSWARERWRWYEALPQTSSFPGSLWSIISGNAHINTWSRSR